MEVKQNMNNINKIFNVIRYIFGVAFILAGLGGLISGDYCSRNFYDAIRSSVIADTIWKNKF